jgi:hypothetical protein
MERNYHTWYLEQVRRTLLKYLGGISGSNLSKFLLYTQKIACYCLSELFLIRFLILTSSSSSSSPQENDLVSMTALRFEANCQSFLTVEHAAQACIPWATDLRYLSYACNGRLKLVLV